MKAQIIRKNVNTRCCCEGAHVVVNVVIPGEVTTLSRQDMNMHMRDRLACILAILRDQWYVQSRREYAAFPQDHAPERKLRLRDKKKSKHTLTWMAKVMASAWYCFSNTMEMLRAVHHISPSSASVNSLTLRLGA